ncbi:MAG: tetratricopeptide repeat protein [Candidatus Omnitrophota bacterium]
MNETNKTNKTNETNESTKKKNRLSTVMLILLGMGCGCGWILSQRALITSRHHSNAPETETDLYLPEPRYLTFISLGHHELVADLVLAKTLSYYGSHYYQRKNFAFKHLKKLFLTAVELDPLNRDAFLMAGNTLADIDTRAAIEILTLGMRYHPQYWKFPEMIGYHYFFRLKDPARAAQYYELASTLPGHPPYVPSLSGKFYEEIGRYEQAIRVLYNFYSTTTDKRLKQSFKASIDEIAEKLRNRNLNGSSK